MRRSLGLTRRWGAAWLLLACIAQAVWAGPTSSPPKAVEVNSATAQALDSIKGIGPRMAQQLVQTRHQARYMDWLDLITRTPGLGANTASKLSANGLRVNGLPFPNLAPSAPR